MITESIVPIAAGRGKWKPPLAPGIQNSEAAVRYALLLFRPELPQRSVK